MFGLFVSMRLICVSGVVSIQSHYTETMHLVLSVKTAVGGGGGCKDEGGDLDYSRVLTSC